MLRSYAATVCRIRLSAVDGMTIFFTANTHPSSVMYIATLPCEPLPSWRTRRSLSRLRSSRGTCRSASPVNCTPDALTRILPTVSSSSLLLSCYGVMIGLGGKRFSLGGIAVFFPSKSRTNYKYLLKNYKYNFIAQNKFFHKKLKLINRSKCSRFTRLRFLKKAFYFIYS